MGKDKKGGAKHHAKGGDDGSSRADEAAARIQLQATRVICTPDMNYHVRM